MLIGHSNLVHSYVGHSNASHYNVGHSNVGHSNVGHFNVEENFLFGLISFSNNTLVTHFKGCVPQSKVKPNGKMEKLQM
jgi:hypothetical protein